MRFLGNVARQLSASNRRHDPATVGGLVARLARGATAIIAAAFLMLANQTGTAQAQSTSKVVTVGGTTYKLYIQNGTYTDLSSSLQSTPWWGNNRTSVSFYSAFTSAGGNTFARFAFLEVGTNINTVSNSGSQYQYPQSYSLNFVLSATNVAPTANAGPDQTVASGASVTLSAASSVDDDGDPITYAWQETSGTGISLSSTMATSPTFTAPTLNVGDPDVTLVFSLSVDDRLLISPADTVTIVVRAPIQPFISSLDRQSGPQSGGTSVTLSGNGFTGATSVQFGGVDAASFSVVNDTEITAVTAAAISAGFVDVTVGNGTNQDAFLGAYEFIAAPAMTGSTLGVAYGSLGTNLDLASSITGTFTSVATATAPTSGTASISGTVVTYVPNAGFFGTDSFTVTATGPGGTSTAATVSVTVAAPQPDITALDPSSGPTSGGTTVTLDGSGFAGTTNVQFGGIDAAAFTVISDTRITAVTAAARSAGYRSILVRNGTNVTLRSGFQFVDAPTVAAATMNVPYASAGTDLDLAASITGTYTTIAVASAPANGTVSVAGTTVTYVPNAGTYGNDSFTVAATGPGGTSAAATVSVTVATPAAPTVAAATMSVPYASTGTDFDLAASITGTYTTIAVASAPAKGTVSVAGTTVTYVPNAGSFGDDSFTVTATGSGGTSSAATVTVTVAPPAAPAVADATLSVPHDSSGTDLDLASSVTGTYTTIAAASAPTKGTVSIAGTVVTYVPTSGTYGADSFTVAATGPGGTSAAATVSVTVAAPAAPTVADATMNVPYDSSGTDFDLSSRVTGTYTTIATASAPSTGTVSIAGTVVTYVPTSGFSGADSFTITATGPGGTSAAATVSVTVAPPPAASLVASPATGALSAGRIGTAYSALLSTSAGTAPYRYALASGALPAGVALDATTGALAGTPTAAGTASFSITASDSAVVANSVTTAYSIIVTAAPVTLVLSPATGTLPAASVSTAYSQTLSASGGTQPLRFAVSSGTLPTGLALDTATGILSGTPTRAASSRFIVRATDAAGNTGTATYTLLVGAGTPVVTVAPAPVAVTGPTTVDLTAGAEGGPFTGADVVSVSPANAGTTQVIMGRTASLAPEEMFLGRYYLDFVPNPAFSGTAVVTFTLSNALGASAPATITFSVEPSIDPAADPEVIGLVNAQVQAAERFAATQTGNINRRLEQLRDPCGGNAFAIRLMAAAEKVADEDNNPMTPNAPTIERARAGERLAATAEGDAPAGRDLIAEGRGKAGSPAASAVSKEVCSDERLAFWTGGYVNFGAFDTSGADILDFMTVGLTAGADYRLFDALTLGVATGYATDKSEIGTEGTTSDAKAISAAVYASYHPTAKTFLDALLGYNWISFQSNRAITADRTALYALGDRDGGQIFGSVTAGYEIRQGGLLLSPYARLNAAETTLDAFTETGGGLYALAFGKQSFTSVTSFLGIETAYAFAFDWGTINPNLRLEWAHDFAGSSQASFAFADWAGDTFDIDIDGHENDYMPLTVGADVKIGEDLAVSFDFRTEIGAPGDDNTFRMSLTGAF